MGHHLEFEPRWRAGMALAAEDAVHAAIDLSDGLGKDLHHVLQASGVGARVDAAAIPRRRLPAGPVSLEAALHDGEDFELLLAIDPLAEERLRHLPALADLEIRRIGTVTAGPDAVLVADDGAVTPFPPGGYEHRL